MTERLPPPTEYHVPRYALTGPAPPPPSSLAEVTARGILRRWRWLALSAVCSGILAIYVANTYMTPQYVFEGKLIYNRSETTAPYFSSPALENLAPLAKSRGTLEMLRADLGLPQDVNELEGQIHVEVPTVGNAMDVNLQWPDQGSAPAVLNRLMELVVNQAREFRLQVVKQHIGEFKAALSASERKHAEAQQQLQDALVAKGFSNLVDIQLELTELRRTISQVELSVEMAESNQAETVPDSARELRKSADATGQEDSPASADDSPAPAENSPGSAAKPSEPVDTGNPVAGVDSDTMNEEIQTRTYLRDLITEQRQRKTNEALLRVKRSEYERAKALYAKRVITPHELQKIEAELAAAAAQVEDSGAIHDMQLKMRQIDQRLALSKRRKAATAAATAGFASRENGAGHVEHWRKILAAKREQFQRLIGVRRETETLSQGVADATLERRRIADQLERLEEACRSKVDELVVVQAPTLAVHGVRSNRQRLFTGTLGASWAVLLLPLILIEWRRAARMARPPQADQLDAKVGSTSGSVRDTDLALVPHEEWSVLPPRGALN